MTSNRRNFLRNITLGSGAVATAIPSLNGLFANSGDGMQQIAGVSRKFRKAAPGSNNMCGYAAPKLNTVRIGFIGLGMRGPGAVTRMSHIDGVEIKALCDKFPERATAQQKVLESAGLPKAKEYSGEEGWKALCENPDIDLVYICTPWHLHTPMALYAMENGKHVATEVPAALSIAECWQLVETSERTRKHCMMLENCCYDFFEMLTLNMARQGMFGDILHAEGAYIHDLVDLNFNKNGYADMWRLNENRKHNGNLYPTHGLGPIAQCMNINRGDQFDYLTSMSTNDFNMGPKALELAAKDDFFKPYVGNKFRGNMNNTIIRTKLGKTLLVQHDVSSPRPYSRIHLVSGSKGVASKWPSPERIAFGHAWVKQDEMKTLTDKYTPQLVKHIGEMAKKVGGHGGMDFMMDWRLIDCLRNGLPLDQDVYDAALWSSVMPLSEESVNNRSKSMDVPDFTRGAWQNNKPHSLTLDGGGNTGVRNIKADKDKQLKVE